MIKSSLFSVIASAVLVVSAPSQQVLDPGLVSTGCSTPRGSSVVAIAQTFRPLVSGKVQVIEHGLQASSGITAFNLYVTPVTTAGTPPSSYSRSAVYIARNLRSFATNARRVDGVIRIPVSASLSVDSTRDYALVFERVAGSTARLSIQSRAAQKSQTA